MKIINATIHGILDYLTVIFLLTAPALFNMEGTLATFTYALGGIHLLLTIFTNFKLGIFRMIPFKTHGLIEFAVAIFLAAAGFWFRNIGSTTGFMFYIILAVVFLIVFKLTNFNTLPNNASVRSKQLS